MCECKQALTHGRDRIQPMIRKPLLMDMAKIWQKNFIVIAVKNCQNNSKGEKNGTGRTEEKRP